MATDSKLFHIQSELEEEGFRLQGAIFRKDGDQEFLPLYEAKMTNLFDHRHGSIIGSSNLSEMSGVPAVGTTLTEHEDPHHCAIPRYWVDKSETDARRAATGWQHQFFISFRDVARATDARTAIHALIPAFAVGHKAPLFMPSGDTQAMTAFYAALNSFSFDYCVRQKFGGASLSFFVLKQSPLVSPESVRSSLRFTASRVLELAFTAWDLEAFAQECSYDGSPFRWDEERRFQLRCELDALFFHLYLPCDDAGNWKTARVSDGAVRDETDEELATLKSHFPTPRDAVDYIMETFPIVKRKDIARTEEKDDDGNVTRDGSYITKYRILEIYDQMLDARSCGKEWQSPLDPPPASFRVTHPPRLPDSSRTKYNDQRLWWTIFLRHFLRQSRAEATLPLLQETLNRLFSPESLLTADLVSIAADEHAVWMDGFERMPAEGIFSHLSDLEDAGFYKVDRETLRISVPPDSGIEDTPDDPWINFDVAVALGSIAAGAEVNSLLATPETPEEAAAFFEQFYQVA